MDQPDPAFEVSRQGEVRIVHFTHATFNRIELNEVSRQLRGLIEHTDRPRLVVDCEHVTQMSSRILGVVMGLHLRTRQRDGELAICTLSQPILELFRLMRLDRVLAIHPTVEDAVASLS